MADVGWVDLHNHILPGLDDGSPDMETTLELGEGLYRLGFEVIVGTPHVHPEIWYGTAEEAFALASIVEEELLDRLRPPGNGDEVDLRVLSAGEHFLDASFLDRLEEGRLLEYPQDRGLLVELSLLPRASHPGLRDIMFRIRVKGYKPVLAHPERYDAAQKSLEWIDQLRDDGVAMLGDLLSIAGKSGRASRRTLERMLDRGMIDGLSTDLHAAEDLLGVEDALGRLEKFVGREQMERYLTWGRAFTG